MTVQVIIPNKYVEILTPFGRIEQAVETALRRYTIEQISTKISELRQRDEVFQKKYGLDYETFVQRTAVDEAFVSHIEATINKTWEADLAEWEFCHQGVEDWTQHLRNILLE
jgi:hypothetical protein